MTEQKRFERDTQIIKIFMDKKGTLQEIANEAKCCKTVVHKATTLAVNKALREAKIKELSECIAKFKSVLQCPHLSFDQFTLFFRIDYYKEYVKFLKSIK
jgi:hypothetical protein